MEWNRYRLETTAQAMEMVIAIFIENEITSFEIEDNVPLSEKDKKEMFIDILPDLPQDDRAYVNFYLKPEQDCEKILSNLKAGLNELKEFTDIGTGMIQSGITKEEDWVNNWKKYFKPFEIDDIIIKPTWEPYQPKDGQLVIEMDPGTAFGTGMHETTQLVIRQLKKYITNQTVLLDVGCGSGILSIIAAKIGIKEAVGTDIDIRAVKAAIENQKVNGVAKEKLHYFVGNVLEEKEVQEQLGYERYDVVVANILADVIIPLSKVIPAQMKQGGIFITSGIIKEKEQEVEEAIRANTELEIIETTYQKDWVSITARKV